MPAIGAAPAIVSVPMLALLCSQARLAGGPTPAETEADPWEDRMRRFLLIAGPFALAIGLLWIGQGTGTVAWPRSSIMVNQLQWAGYGAAVAGLGLVLIWQSNP